MDNLSDRILFSKEDNIGIITLDKKPLNVFDASFYREVKAAFEKVNEMDDVFVIILRSSQKHFSAGGDLGEIQSVNEENVAYICRQVANCMSTIYTCKKPVIAAVNGKAIGAGLALAASCDVIIAAENAQFILPEIKVGFIGAAEFLELLAPRKEARYYAYTGNVIPNEKLLAWGGVHAFVPDEQLMEEAVKTAKEFMQNAPLALSCFKELMNINDDERLDEKYMRGAGFVIRNSQTDDFKECHKAINEKRAPHYTGK